MVLRLVAVDNSPLETVRVAGVMLDQLINVIELLHQQTLVIAACGDVDQSILGCLEVAVIQERRLQRLTDCIPDTVLSLACAAAHQRHSAVVHHLLDILEVHIHKSPRLNDVHHGTHSCGQHLISLRESVLDQQVAVEFVQLLIVDDEQAVHIAFQLVDAVNGP